MRKVYVVKGIRDMSEFSDYYGETANDEETIVGIYSTEEKANSVKEKLEKENETDKAECDCDDTQYRVDEYNVE